MGSEAKNWRGLLIALLVIAAVCGVILLVIVIVTPGNYFCFISDKMYPQYRHGIC